MDYAKWFYDNGGIITKLVANWQGRSFIRGKIKNSKICEVEITPSTSTYEAILFLSHMIITGVTVTPSDLKQIEDLIEDEEYDKAQELVDKIRNEFGDFSQLIRLQVKINCFN